MAIEGKSLMQEMINTQSNIARSAYKQHSSPSLYEKLKPDIATVSTSGGELNININYPLTIRLLDLKRGRANKEKTNYTPIYNKILFGYLFGRSNSLADRFRVELFERWQAHYRELNAIMTEHKI